MSPISYADKMSPIKWAEQVARNKEQEKAKEQEQENAANSPLMIAEDVAGASPAAPIRTPKVNTKPTTKARPATRKAR